MAENTKVFNTPEHSMGDIGQTEKVKIYGEKKKGLGMWLWLIPLLVVLGIAISYVTQGAKPAAANTSIGAVYFATGSAALTSNDQKMLSKAVGMMKDDSGMRLRVQGYTDSAGDPAQNIALSQQRSAAVQEYLTANGIDKSRLDLQGFGQADPVDTNGTSGGKANNRRVELFK